MTTAAPARPHITPLILRSHAHLHRLREDSARQIRQAFAVARDQARPHIQQFTQSYGQELARQRENEEVARVPLVWIAGHLAMVQGPLMRAVSTAAHAAQNVTIQSQSTALIDGQQAGYQRVAAITPQGSAQHAPPTPRDRFGVSGHNGQPLSLFYAPLAAQAWQKAQKAAYAGTATGQDDSNMQGALEAAILGVAAYALLVDETEITLAWRYSLADTYVANSDLLIGWLWAALGPDPCPFCESMNGTIHPLDADLDSHPRCNCEQVPIAANDL